MAILLPRVSPDAIEHRSEREVASALLETLDDDWVIYHSYPWLQNHEIRRGALHEGEADFVLLHPVFGLFILEVKGGEVCYDSDSGRWTQNLKQMKESPFEQARRNMHALREQIGHRSRLDMSRAFDHGYAVCFPDSRFQGTPPPGSQPQIIFGSTDLPFLGSRVQTAMKSWRSGEPRRMDTITFKELKDAVMGTFNIVPSLSRALKKEGESLIRLTDDQKRIMDGLAQNSSVGVEGVAGSGKTLLALHQAVRWAEAGKKALMLCFNSFLAEDLRSRVTHDNLHVYNFHSFAAEMCKKAGVEFSVPRDPSEQSYFWDFEVPLLLMEALESEPSLRYDAIVVDEAQDFHREFWMVLDDAFREGGGPLFFFYDHSQSLFREDSNVPSCQTQYTLRTNCRNTSAIASACGRVIAEEIDTRYTPEGVEPEIKLLTSAESYAGEVGDLLDKLLKEEKLDPSQVAVLHPFKEAPIPTDRLGKHTFTGSLKAWDNGKGVWCSTIRSFKGLESDVLILIDLPEVGQRHFHKSDLYVACSRARLRLYIFTQAPGIRSELLEELT